MWHSECHFVKGRKQPSKRLANEEGFCKLVHNFEIGSARS